MSFATYDRVSHHFYLSNNFNILIFVAFPPDSVIPICRLDFFSLLCPPWIEVFLKIETTNSLLVNTRLLITFLARLAYNSKCVWLRRSQCYKYTFCLGQKFIIYCWLCNTIPKVKFQKTLQRTREMWSKHKCNSTGCVVSFAHVEGFWQTLQSDRPQIFVSIYEISIFISSIAQVPNNLLKSLANETKDASLLLNMDPKRRLESVRVDQLRYNFCSFLYIYLKYSICKRNAYLRLYCVKTSCFLWVLLHPPSIFFKRRNCSSHKRHVFTHSRPVRFEAHGADCMNMD